MKKQNYRNIAVGVAIVCCGAIVLGVQAADKEKIVEEIIVEEDVNTEKQLKSKRSNLMKPKKKATTNIEKKEDEETKEEKPIYRQTKFSIHESNENNTQNNNYIHKSAQRR